MENFGEKLYDLRKSKGISQAKFAVQAQVTRQTVSKWENNTVKPDDENLNIICEILEVGREYFFEEVAMAADEAKKEALDAAKKEALDVVKAEVANEVEKQIAYYKYSKSNKRLIVGIVITSIVLCFFIAATVILGHIVFDSITGDIVANTDDIDIDLFFVFLAATILISALDVFFIVLKIKNRKCKQNVNKM